MSFKETLKAENKLDRLLQKLIATIREPPGKRWLDKVLTQELLDMQEDSGRFKDWACCSGNSGDWKNQRHMKFESGWLFQNPNDRQP